MPRYEPKLPPADPDPEPVSPIEPGPDRPDPEEPDPDVIDGPFEPEEPLPA
jgi:hypothetical protein